MEERTRCPWAQGELYCRYHDEEWGKPTHDERELFELLILEGQQAGLSWLTILNKRENFRKAYDNFDAQKIAGYGDAKVEALMQDAGIIRNRRKVLAAISNAQAYLKMLDEGLTLDAYLWGFVDGTPIVNHFARMEDVPAKTPLSDAISRDLKKRGFSFVGSTIVYAYMQSTGMVDDHLTDCFVRSGK